MPRWIAILAVLLTISWTFSCGQPDVPRGGTVVVALPADADLLNPLLWSTSSTGTVLQFLFPDLTNPSFDTATGQIAYSPHAAASWEWSEDGTALTYHLRSDLRWSDGHPMTANDIKFSYELYSDPAVGSVRRGSLAYLLKTADGKPDIERAILVPDDSTITFRFTHAYEKNQQLNHTQLNFIPKHVFEKIPRGQIRTSDINFHPVGGHHFVLGGWVRKQEIVLERNPDWGVPHSAYIDKIVFRVIPDMTTRVIELKTGGVDIVEGLSPEDARSLLQSRPNVRMERQSFRRFDYLGWSLIDQNVYRKSGKKTVRPHTLFGDRRVRRALTMAIHREELIEGWLGEYGQACIGPVSPALKWAYNDTLRPIPYDPDGARRLLDECGWSDHNGDGFLDKDGRKFEFTIVTNTANPRREFAVQKIQSDLRKIGIQCETQFLESNQFSAGLREKSFDAFVAGLSTNLYVDLKPQLGSDLQKNVFNYYSYQNPVVDSLIEAASSKLDLSEAGPIFRQIQAIVHEDQPAMYLFWFDNIVGVNNRVQGTSVDIFSAYHNFWNWHVRPR